MDKTIYRKGLRRQLNLNTQETLAMIATYRFKPKTIKHERRVPYGPGRLNYIKTYCLKELENVKKPLFLYIHGGGWISGVTKMRNPYIMNWAELGFFTASVSYSYAPQKIYPVQIQEIFTAIDFIFDNADKYKIDTDNIVIAGESAGSYFISFVAAYANNPSVLEKLGVKFKNVGKLKINALVSHSGCFNFPRLFDENTAQSAFPFLQMMSATFFGMTESEFRDYMKTETGKLSSPVITADFPPSYLVCGAKDILRYETYDMSGDLTAVGVANGVYTAEGFVAKHAWTIATKFRDARVCLDATYDFILPYVSEYFEKKNGTWTLK